VDRHPGRVLAVGAVALIAAFATVPSLQTATKLEAISRYDDPAFVGQRLLSSRFGLEGAPLVLLMEGTEQDVLTRAAAIEGELEAERRSGRLRAVFVPTSLVPSPDQQSRRQRALQGLDLVKAAGSLEEAIREKGLDPAAFRGSVEMLRRWAAGALPTVTVESARRALPPGLLDVGIRQLGPDRYVGAVTLYSGSTDATASLSPATESRLHEKAGAFAAFSYDRVAAELNGQIMRDSRRASVLATVAVLLIVAGLFRRVRVGLLVLLPIACGVVLTIGVLTAAGHRFGGMAFAAYPLILGLGIDNSIHLVRRHLESPATDVRQLLGASGAALIQTNLTTIVGFAALLSATIPPLAEFGLITALGIGFTLLASLFLLPAILALVGRRPWLQGRDSG
jgi:predicted exporter